MSVLGYMKPSGRNTTLISLIVVIAVVAIIMSFVSHAYITEADNKDRVLLAWTEGFIQLFILGIVGGGIKWIFDRINEERKQLNEENIRRREQLNKINAFRTSLIDDIVHVRTEIERHKREFCIGESKNQLVNYRNLIHKLTDLRIRLSRIWHNIQTSETSFSEADKLKEHIVELKNFLDSLHDEYNADEIAEHLDIKASEQKTLLKEKPFFADYIGWDDYEEYYSTFLSRYREALKLLRKDILSGTALPANQP